MYVYTVSIFYLYVVEPLSMYLSIYPMYRCSYLAIYLCYLCMYVSMYLCIYVSMMMVMVITMMTFPFPQSRSVVVEMIFFAQQQCCCAEMILAPTPGLAARATWPRRASMWRPPRVSVTPAARVAGRSANAASCNHHRPELRFGHCPHVACAPSLPWPKASTHPP